MAVKKAPFPMAVPLSPFLCKHNHTHLVIRCPSHNGGSPLIRNHTYTTHTQTQHVFFHVVESSRLKLSSAIARRNTIHRNHLFFSMRRTRNRLSDDTAKTNVEKHSWFLVQDCWCHENVCIIISVSFLEQQIDKLFVKCPLTVSFPSKIYEATAYACS